MAIRGDLLSVDLSNVFQMLAMNRKRGVLHLQNRENILEKRALVLDADRVGLLRIPEGHDLAAILVDQGELSFEDYADATEKSRQFKVQPVNYLLKRGRLTQEQVDGAVTRLHEELILEIFLWKNVSFHLDEEAWPEDDERRRFFILDLTVMEAARRQDEWSRVMDLIGGGRDIWARTGADVEEASAAFPAIERIVFNQIDNIKGSQEITEATGLPRYHVDSALANLSQRGNIRKLELDDLIEVGDQLVQQGRYRDGIRLFKCAVRHDRRSIALHKRLAQAYLKEKRVAKAAAHYKFCAIALVEKGLLREALTIYQYLISILPTDFRSLEQSLALLARLDDMLSADDRKTLDLGLKLCQFYFDTRKYQDAERILEDLLAVAPEDVGLAYMKAKVQAKSGHINEAVETYMRLAAMLHARGDLDGALNAYKLVVSFDAATKDICLQKITEIRQVLARRRRKRMAGATFFVMAVILVICAAGYLYYHNSAEAAFDRIAAGESDLMTEEAWRTQAHQYAGMAEEYPLTMAASRARRQEEHALARVAEFRRAVQKRQAGVREKEKQSLSRAEENMARARGYLVMGDLRQALNEYRDAWASLKRTKQESWGRNQPRQIPDRIAELEQHLKDEEAALKRIDAFLKAGERERAFKVARESFFKTSAGVFPDDSTGVVSRETLQKIRVPLDVKTAPPDSLLRDENDREARGVLRPVLNAAGSRLRVEISRPGYRSQEITLLWDKSPFRTLVAMEKVPAERRELGDRVHSVVQGFDGPIVLAGNGVVYALSDWHGSRSRFEPESFVTPSTPVVAFNGGAAFGTTQGRLIYFDFDAKAPQSFNRRLSLDPLAALVVFEDRLLAATNDGKPRLRIFDARGEEVGEGIALKSPLVTLVEDQGHVMGVDEDGAFVEIDARKMKVKGRVEGRFTGQPRIFGDAILLCDDLGRIHRLGAGLDSGPSFDSRYRVKGDCLVVGGVLVASLRDGGLLILDEEFKTRTVGRFWAPLLRQASGRLTARDNNHVFVELEDGRQILVDIKNDQVLCAYMAESGARTIPFTSGHRVVMVCQDAHGAVEIYRD